MKRDEILMLLLVVLLLIAASNRNLLPFVNPTRGLRGPRTPINGKW